MKFTLVIPVYNEGPIIKQTIQTVFSILSKIDSKVDWEIVIVDNGSTDHTKKEVLSLELPKISLVSIDQKGKGMAIIHAASQCNSDFFGFIDADLSADPESIILMLNELITRNSDIIIGSRFVDSTKVKREFFRTFTSRVFNILQRIILNMNIKDTQCGLKIMNKNGVEILKNCKEKGWFFDLELLYRAKKQNLKVIEYSIFWDEFRYYKERETKLKIIDSVHAIIAMFRIRNYINL